MIEVKLSFNSTNELLDFFTGAKWNQVANSAVDFTAANVSNEILPQAAVAAEIARGAEQVTEETAVKDTPKRQRKPKNEPAVAASEPVATEPVTESVAEQPAAEANYTVDDVRKALQEYVAKTDFATGTALVKSFGASRITEIPAERFAEFIAKTQEQVAA